MGSLKRRANGNRVPSQQQAEGFTRKLGMMPLDRSNSVSKSFLSRREAADSATARQGEATTTGMI